MNEKKCCLCGKMFKEWGNNPAPLADSKDSCCDDCNLKKVIPARLKKFYSETKKNEKYKCIS